MEDKGSMVTPKADQPRMESSQLTRLDAPANIEYRVQGMRNYGGRVGDRSYRANKRGF